MTEFRTGLWVQKYDSQSKEPQLFLELESPLPQPMPVSMVSGGLLTWRRWADQRVTRLRFLCDN